MFQLLSCLIGIACVLVHATHAQNNLDPITCQNWSPSPIWDPRWRAIPSRFEIITELVESDGVAELSQAFSSTRDAIALNAKNTAVQFYWNFLTNEQFEVINAVVAGQVIPNCLRQVIRETSATSVLTPGALTVKPSILLGYDARNQLNKEWTVAYLDDGELRGIPTNRFRSCFYLKDIQATVSTIYHVSDPNKFISYLGPNNSLILQMDVSISVPTGRRESYTYNVFRYKPNPSRWEERQALETPGGVFCSNRTATIPVPRDIPGRASSNVEAFIPVFNSSIVSTHGLYDTEFEFSKFDIWFPDPRGGPEWDHITQIHDFAVGLSYTYNHADHHCAVTDINTNTGDSVPVDGHPDLIQMGGAQHLFLMDDIIYHYTGEKRCRDRVMCNVWIGEKPMENNTVQHREWHWAINVNGQPLVQWVPMKLVIKQLYMQVPVFTAEMNIFNFRRNPMTLLEVDHTLAECYRALGPSQNYHIAVLSFTIKNDKNYPVNQNLNYLRLHIFETLLFTLFVRPVRLSHLIVDQDGEDIVVTFTLLDAPPRTGPVENPLKEADLDRVIERLEHRIDEGELVFRAKYGTKTALLHANKNSLNVVHRAAKVVYLKSGPKITGLWIGLIIVGILIGVAGGFVVFRKLANK